jgi:hypothetical protein
VPWRADHPGRKRLDARKVLCGVLFVLYTGIPWEFLPQQLGFGSRMTCWRRLRDWHRAGVSQRLHKLLGVVDDQAWPVRVFPGAPAVETVAGGWLELVLGEALLLHAEVPISRLADATTAQVRGRGESQEPPNSPGQLRPVVWLLQRIHSVPDGIVEVQWVGGCEGDLLSGR